jgi:hypothetical protein
MDGIRKYMIIKDKSQFYERPYICMPVLVIKEIDIISRKSNNISEFSNSTHHKQLLKDLVLEYFKWILKYPQNK